VAAYDIKKPSRLKYEPSMTWSPFADRMCVCLHAFADLCTKFPKARADRGDLGLAAVNAPLNHWSK